MATRRFLNVGALQAMTEKPFGRTLVFHPMAITWDCESCGRSGILHLTEDTPYSDVVELIRKDHATPECEWQPASVWIDFQTP